MSSKSLIIVIVLVLIILVSVGGYLYISQTNKTSLVSSPTTQPVRTLIPSPQPQKQPISPSPESTIPANWKTYTNSAYGFEISFPENYQALDSPDDLYGWPNGVVLIYGGGQAHDVAIEIWDNQTDYQGKYPNEEVEKHSIGTKYLTIADITGEVINSEIIFTFKLENN
jgi:hypothetical protein